MVIKELAILWLYLLRTYNCCTQLGAFTIVKLFMRLILLICLLLQSFVIYSQSKSIHSFEISTQIRREKQAEYTAPYGTAISQNALQLYGTSTGIDVGYKRILKGRWIKPSIGFYKFSIDKIINNRIPARPSDPLSSRPINYQPDSLPFGYSTSKYHYNNLALGFTLGKGFLLKKNLFLTTNFSFTYLATFSQYYDAAQGYKTTNNKGFGYLFDYNVGIQKEFKELYIATNFILPMYKEWKQDVVFKENPNSKVHYWFGGYGLLITIGKFLK
jgi:hypothetical protein